MRRSRRVPCPEDTAAEDRQTTESGAPHRVLQHIALTCLLLPLALAGCGGDKPKATLSVTCGGSVALAGATTIDVLGDPVNGRPTLTFPDPANPGKTGAMAIAPASRCSITPTTGG